MNNCGPAKLKWLVTYFSTLLPPHLSHQFCLVLGLSYLAALCNLHSFHFHFFDISSPEKDMTSIEHTLSQLIQTVWQKNTVKMHTLTKKKKINNICKCWLPNLLCLPPLFLLFYQIGTEAPSLSRSCWPQGLLAGRGNSGCGMCVFPFVLGLNQQAYIQKGFWFHFFGQKRDSSHSKVHRL